ncbi:MAG: NAD-dependent epimerase/dehydratase family protein [Polynucleobacter sp.]
MRHVADGWWGNIRAVFHEGACTNTMENDGAYMMQANYQFSNDLCTIADAQKVPFIYASSAAVYGRSKAFEEKRINERPLNVFAYSKFLCDQYKRGHIESKTYSALGYKPPAHQTQVPQLLQNQPILLQ